MAPALLSSTFFFDLAIILMVSRIVARVAQRVLKQPRVVGEMIAGVILGPSLLGSASPRLEAMLFPSEIKSLLYVVAQLGVGLYMFLVGTGLRRQAIATHWRGASVISFAGIAVPFLLALPLIPWLIGVPGLFGAHVTTTQAALFTGACVAITAFPMLARIVHERGLSNTSMGTLSLIAGAIDDVAAWIVLAVVLATFGGGWGVAVKAVVGGGLFAAAVLISGPLLLGPLHRRTERRGELGASDLAFVLSLFLVSAGAMDAIGLHAVFGGFLIGIVIPRGVATDELRRLLEPLTTVLLLPVFFAYSGLNTQLSLIGSASVLAVTLAILLVSVIGKGGGCWGAARLLGHDNATALGIGALMNARGLMELIIINIGLSNGIIGPTLFSVFVVMAITTTTLTTPAFDLVVGRVTDDGKRSVKASRKAGR